jgi:hypothetical protein
MKWLFFCVFLCSIIIFSSCGGDNNPVSSDNNGYVSTTLYLRSEPNTPDIGFLSKEKGPLNHVVQIE